LKTTGDAPKVSNCPIFQFPNYSMSFSYQVKGCGSLNLRRCLARQGDEAHWKLVPDNNLED